MLLSLALGRDFFFLLEALFTIGGFSTESPKSLQPGGLEGAAEAWMLGWVSHPSDSEKIRWSQLTPGTMALVWSLLNVAGCILGID